MSFLDGILGNNAGDGADPISGVNELIQSQGGVQGLTQKFSAGGLGDIAASWIGKGNNMPISAQQIEAVLGSGPIGQFAQKLGVSPAQAANVLAMALPMIIDRLTPQGDAKAADQSDNALGGLLDNLPGGLGGLLGGMLKK